MNRIQFFILTGLSSLVVLLLVGQILLGRMTGVAQYRNSQAQALINQGQASQQMVKQLAIRIFSDSQKTQDQGLKDLLARQQISYNAGGDSNATENPAPPAVAPAPIPSPTH